MAEITTNAQLTQDRTRLAAMGVGAAAFTTNPGDLGVVALECAYGPFHLTRLNLNGFSQTVVNGTEYQGNLLYTFPVGRIIILGCVCSLTPTTTSDVATTLNASKIGNFGLGTTQVASASVTLATTDINISPGTGQTPTTFTTSATTNAAGTLMTSALNVSSTAQFDGTSTAIKVYLNSSFSTTGDIDADATFTWAGYINILWAHIGDY